MALGRGRWAVSQKSKLISCLYVTLDPFTSNKGKRKKLSKKAFFGICHNFPVLCRSGVSQKQANALVSCPDHNLPHKINFWVFLCHRLIILSQLFPDPGLLIFRGKKSKISRDFPGQIRGKIGWFRGIFAGKKSKFAEQSADFAGFSREKSQNSQKKRPISREISGGNFTKKQSVKNSRFRRVFFGKFR